MSDRGFQGEITSLLGYVLIRSKTPNGDEQLQAERMFDTTEGPIVGEILDDPGIALGPDDEIAGVIPAALTKD